MITSDSYATMYRPQVLDQIRGHSHAVQTVRGYIKQRRFPNALLLTGKTGVGKTTFAQVIAREINGEGWKADTDEINSGDERGIDAVRNMVESARFLPRSNLRFIICNEVHAFTPQAAQALLVPLESPPPTTSYILTTSEPDKILPAIRGRCVPLHLTDLNEQDVVSLLTDVVQRDPHAKKVRKLVKPLLPQLARLSGFQPRLALQLLEKVVAMSATDTDSLVEQAATALNLEVGVDLVGAKFILCFLLGKKRAALSTLLDTRNMRALIDVLLVQNLDLLKLAARPDHQTAWQTKKLLELLNRNQIEPQTVLPQLVRLHKVLSDLKTGLYYGSDEVNLAWAAFGTLLMEK